ncbi:hypothetical protein, partial [Pseudomonas gingeri]
CHAGGRGFESRPLRHIRCSGPLNARTSQEARLVRAFCCLLFAKNPGFKKRLFKSVRYGFFVA